jgi:crotonobetainyl-CoA:carnitine CoA-transferase CaiB-like acyl-CoA transferase
MAILAALYWRDVNGGTGQVIDNAIIEANYRLIDYTMLDYEKLGIVRERTGNRLGDLAPRNSYETSDGGWIAISGGTQGIVERLFHCIDRPELVDDPRFENNASRIKNVVALDEAISAWMIQHTTADILAAFDEQGVSGAPVNNVAQIADNEHFRARDLLLSVDDPELGLTSTVHVHPRMSATPGGVKFLGGTIGRDNESFYLEEMGLSREEFDALTAAGAI